MCIAKVISRDIARKLKKGRGHEARRPYNIVNEPREILFSLLLLENFHSHIVDSAVIKNNNTTVGPGFYMYTTVFAEIVITAAKVVANGLNSGVEPVCKDRKSVV